MGPGPIFYVHLFLFLFLFCILYFLDYLAKSLGRIDSQVCQDLPVEFDIQLFQAMDKAAIRETIVLCRSFDADNPQPSEISLAGSSVPVGIKKGSLHRFFSCAVVMAPRSPKTLGQF